MRLLAAALLAAAAASLPSGDSPQRVLPRRLVYVAAPASAADPDRSTRLLVFDGGSAHRFVGRIPLWPAASGGDEETVRAIAASTGSRRRLFLSTTRRLAAIDADTREVVWQQRYDLHCCDRFAVSPDGRTI